MSSFERIQLADKARILVVRRDNIGDLVCTTPMLHALREAFPGAQIGVLANVYNAEVLVGNPDVDRVFVYQKIKHINGAWPKIKAFYEQALLKIRLRLWSPSVSILARSNYDRHGLKFLRSIGARNVVGYQGDGYAAQPDIALVPRDFESQHEVEFLSELLKTLCVNVPAGALRIFPQPGLAEAAHLKLGGDGPKLAIHVSARDPERQWGLDHWYGLIRVLLDAHRNLRVGLLWAPGQQDNAYINGEDQFAAKLMAMVNNPRLIPMPVKTIPELVATVDACDGFVGADGGAMHIAAALQKPLVVLFEESPQKWQHWYPWRAPAQIIKAPKGAISSIPPVVVYKAVSDLLDKVYA